ncbi:hypothetical protein [Paenibacillus pabuli]|uniref:hypothetical protein n=1 Tax=Paenibacillus pabuli TaxID=1472 RepID=UPI000785454E|nr:hypothetical protein [Paenibacillus pabuli]MEC0127845.1 hypothetical protein [Paenibacillus pabuli]
MTEDRSAVIIEAVFTSWSDAESARRALELLHPNQLSVESVQNEAARSNLENPDASYSSSTAIVGGFSGELNVLSLISDKTEILSGGQVYDDAEDGSAGRPRQEILLTVSVSSDSLPQAAEMITQNGGRFC